MGGSQAGWLTYSADNWVMTTSDHSRQRGRRNGTWPRSQRSVGSGPATISESTGATKSCAFPAFRGDTDAWCRPRYWGSRGTASTGGLAIASVPIGEMYAGKADAGVVASRTAVEGGHDVGARAAD
jgi:hypothetical protein